MNDYKLEQDDDPQAGDKDFLSHQISDYSTAQMGYNDARPLAFFIRDRNDQIVGGVYGHTYWGWLAIKLLWVHEDLRGQGLGKRLLQAAEGEAIARDCHHALLNTKSHQAPEFYERHGYELYGVLEDWPGEHQRLYYRKRLEADNRGTPPSDASRLSDCGSLEHSE